MPQTTLTCTGFTIVKKNYIAMHARLKAVAEFCSRECKDEYWQKLRRQVTEEIYKQRSGGEQCQKN